MKKYYIYAFLDGSKPGIYKYEDIIFNYEPFYIGKGTDNRIKSSLLDRECPFKVNKIKKIINSGAEIISIKIFENLENLEAFEKEKEVISKIGRRNMKMGPLVNLTDGGDGRLNSPHSEETKRKISETKQKIVPMTINQFLILLEALIARKKKGSQIFHHEMKSLFDSIVDITKEVSNSDTWMATIPETIIKWKNKIAA